MAIKHWSNARGTSRTVAIGYYDNDGFWGRSTNLSHISLGVGDGTSLCRGGSESNEDYLYVTYMKLCGETPEEQADISKLGFCNGEVYLTGSNTGGNTWSVPVNLTNTKLPDCTSETPDSLCPSESWVTIARDVSDIEIFYVHDFESGFYGESPWTINLMMYLNLPGGGTDAEFVCPLLAPNFSAFLTSDPECEYHANPGVANVETLTIINLGNDDMVGTVTVTAGDSWLLTV